MKRVDVANEGNEIVPSHRLGGRPDRWVTVTDSVATSGSREYKNARLVRPMAIAVGNAIAFKTAIS